jgi:hypothetical protein
MTTIDIKENSLYLNGNLSQVFVSDFNLDFGLQSCQHKSMRMISKPVLKRLFLDYPVSLDIKIETNLCLYEIRKILLSIHCVSERIKLSVHYTAQNTEESFFKKIGHDDILKLRYIHLFECLLDRVFKFDFDLFYYILYGCCYENLIKSENPECNSYELFINYAKYILDDKLLTKDFYMRCLDDIDDLDLLQVHNNTFFPTQNAIERYRWIDGYFYDNLTCIKDLLTKQMNVDINNHIRCFDPIIDKNFRSIIEEVVN